MSVTVVSLKIVETIHYGRDFTVDELSELCVKHGISPYEIDGETGDLTAWLQDEAVEAIRREDGLQDDIEQASGDIQSQSWEWKVKR